MSKLLKVTGSVELILESGTIRGKEEFCYKEEGDSIKISSQSSMINDSEISINISGNNNIVMNVSSVDEDIVVDASSGVTINGESVSKQECSGKKTSSIEINFDLKEIKVSGTSSLTIQNQLPNLNKIEASGASKIKIKKTNTVFRKNVDISLRGSSVLLMDHFQAKKMYVSTRGASKVVLSNFMAEMLELDSSGASLIEIYGEALSIKKHSSGSSRIKT